MTVQERDVFVFPMSFAQQRLWFLEQLQPGGALYNLAALLELRGPLDPAALAGSVNRLIERHESLRTTFAMADGQPVQLVSPAAPIEVPLHPAADRDQALAAARTRCLEPFDLAAGPLVRVELFALGPDEHLLAVAMHHIVSDGWSMSVFVGDLSAFYAAEIAGSDLDLPPLPIQYADYAAWQREWLGGAEAGSVLAAQTNFWREQLAGAPTLLELPGDRPRPAAQSFRGRSFEFAIPAALAEQLRRLQAATGTTAFMPLLGVFATLLGRYTRQADLVIGTPIANRTRAETEGLIGFFVNTLALRLRLPDEATLLTLLDDIRRASLAAHEHQDIPFEQLVGALNLERSLSHTPLFQVMFAYQNAPAASLDVAGLALRQLPLDLGTAKFDLTLFVEEEGGKLIGRLEYNSDLFDGATIERMSGHFLALLAGALREPTRPLREIGILTSAERTQTLAEWNQTAAPYPQTACLHDLVAAQAARTPDAVAVRCEGPLGGTALTYRELDAHANRLAHYLRAHGVGPDTLVGICAARRPEMVVGLLGVLKAGGAYVPLDPKYPAERLRFMAEDAGIKVLLLVDQSADMLAVDGLAIDLIADWPVIAGQPATAPLPAASPDNLAYVIYTSGSTGTPKGALIPHRGVVNYLHWAAAAYPFDRGCGAPVASSLAFDATITALWGPLISGRAVDLLPEDGELEALADSLARRRGYSLLKITPAHMEALSQVLPAETGLGSAGCQAFVIGGEALLAQHIAFWRRNAPDIRLINEYGPTETVVGCAIYEVTGDESPAAAVPIGRPIANTELYVLDPAGLPLPVGVPGELYIGGLGVGRGYHNRPELTAERFIELDRLPALRAELRLAGAAGSPRLYRSGDLVRYLPSGDLEYLGRIDQQVKLHGFRIELGEIEAALCAHPQVHAAAALLREDRPGHKRLVGYVVPADQPAPAPGELAAFLRERLPEYMVPAAFVALPELPLTPNGKVDRRALPPPAPERPAAGAAADEPQDATETALAAIWSRVLGVEHVGRHANFFGLGGDSILAMQVVGGARAIGLTLTPRQIFQHQTLAALAAAATAGAGRTTAERAPDPASLTGPVPLTPIQRWFAARDLANPHHYNQSVVLEVAPDLDSAALQMALDRLIEIHPALRLRWAPAADGWQQAYQPAAPVPLIERSFAEPPSGHSPTLWQDAVATTGAVLQTSMHLTDGPLFQAALLRGPASARLLLAAHHAVIDGVSWRILLDDLAALLGDSHPLAGPRGGATVATPGLPFGHWAAQLADLASQPATLADLDYWTATVAAMAPTIEQSTPDGMPPAIGGTQTVLPGPTTARLLGELPAALHASMPEILLAALAEAWRSLTGESALLLDLEHHGRPDDLDLSRSVGWFTSLYPARLDLAGADEPGAALKVVKQQLRAIPTPLGVPGLSYGLLRFLHPDPAVREGLRGTSPLVFNYLGQLDTAGGAGPFRGLAAENAGAASDPANRRSHRLEINAYVRGGELIVDWEWSGALDSGMPWAALARGFVAALDRLAAPTEQPALIPSDFPAARVSGKDLDSLLARLKQKGN